jgi:hypothetical protein
MDFQFGFNWPHQQSDHGQESLLAVSRHSGFASAVRRFKRAHTSVRNRSGEYIVCHENSGSFGRREQWGEHPMHLVFELGVSQFLQVGHV